ncbi:MAG: hypothetical protein KDD44_15365, partial [Bdellovibrionales bacterium]|nr:hypothetical protein [Bdellovibrionales bacterium]
FIEKGIRNQEYLQALVDWESKLHTANSTNYEGKGTALENLYPLTPDNLTPGRHPSRIFETYERLAY